MAVFIGLLLLFFATPSQAAFLQYKTDTMEVVGASDNPIGSVTGHAVVQDDRFTVANYPWPAPSGCPTGKLEWTQVDTANPLALSVEPGLFFRCELVESADDVDNVVKEKVNASTQQQTSVEFDEMLSAFRKLVRDCPPAITTQECIDKRAEANAVLDEAKIRQDANDELRKDAARFKANNL